MQKTTGFNKKYGGDIKFKPFEALDGLEFIDSAKEITNPIDALQNIN